MKWTAVVVVAVLGLAWAPAAQAQSDADVILELLERTLEEEAERGLDRTDAPASADEAAVQEQVGRVLDHQRITVQFTDTAFADALDFVRDVTGLNIVVTRAVRDEVEEGVTLRLRGVKVRNCFELLLRQVSPDLRYGVRNGVLLIGLAREWRQRKFLRLIPIDDLIHRPPDFPAPRLGLGGIDEPMTFEWEESD